MTEARSRFEEGVKLAESGDHESARLKFNQAWALLKSPAILYNLSRAEHLSNHPVEALEHYRQFQKWPADPKVTEAQRQRASESITELSKKVGQIEIEAPAGARLSVDGKAIDASNADPIPVAPGKHAVEAIVDGKSRSVTIDCPAGTITKAKLNESPSSPSAIGASVATAPAATANASSSPVLAPSPPADARASGFWTTGRGIGVGLFAGGVAALGAGVVFHLGAADSEKAAETIRVALPEPRASACQDPTKNPQCPALRDNVDDQTTRENLRTAFFIGGGALVVGGAVLFLVSSPNRDATRGSAPQVVPIATGRETGLAVVGQF